MSNLTVLSEEIRETDGLYCLNDLHRASGGLKKHQPANFIRTEQAQELIDEIVNSSDLRSLPVKQIQGRNGGTYACKELVYAYAMWISAKFHLYVIRAFDSMQNPPEPEAYSEETISFEQYIEWKHTVGSIGMCFRKSYAAEYAVWRLLRKTAGVQGKTTARHIPAAKVGAVNAVLKQIKDQAEAYRDQTVAIETRMFRYNFNGIDSYRVFSLDKDLIA